MNVILRRLRKAGFTELFDTSRGIPLVAVNFIAMLDLSRESPIEKYTWPNCMRQQVWLAYLPP